MLKQTINMRMLLENKAPKKRDRVAHRLREGEEKKIDKIKVKGENKSVALCH